MKQSRADDHVGFFFDHGTEPMAPKPTPQRLLPAEDVLVLCAYDCRRCAQSQTWGLPFNQVSKLTKPPRCFRCNGELRSS